jgi:siroheme synthase
MMGRVHLVGAGPGDPGLLTVRGRVLLERADVVVHDALVPARLHEHVSAGAEIVAVGPPHGDPRSRALDRTRGKRRVGIRQRPRGKMPR